MSKRRPSDVNALAARIVAEATGQAEKTEPPEGVVDDPSPRAPEDAPATP